MATKFSPEDRAKEGISLNAMFGADRETLREAWDDLQGQVSRQPALISELQSKFQSELWSIWFGGSEVEPPEDGRFRDVAWRDNPFYRRIAQAYAVWSELLDEWLERSDLEGIEQQRAAFLIEAAKDAFAPVNLPIAPEALRAALDTRGQSVVNGLQNLWSDLQSNHGYPAVADREAFEIGKDVANTPGQVVFKNELLELIQYEPTTEKVRKRPVLYVFSQVNRFYLGDLTEERSLFRKLLNEGLQVFAVSWKNPTREQADWSLETYAEGVIEAISVIREVASVKKVDLMGLCAGGITAAAAAGALKARGDDWIKSLSLFVTILDNQPGDSDFSLFATDESVAAQKLRVRAQGMMSERDVLEMFAMLRLDDNVFSFVRSNYLRGEAPLAHPLLFWSMDYTRVPAEMQCDLIDLGHRNDLAQGRYRALGQTVDLSRIDYPVYIAAGSTDHITPWPACYRSVHLFGGDSTFVLSNQAHTQTISAKPNPHLKYWMADELLDTSEEWLATAHETAGDWRDHWVRWLKSHSKLVKAPKALGSTGYPPIMPAPGEYVLES